MFERAAVRGWLGAGLTARVASLGWGLSFLGALLAAADPAPADGERRPPPEIEKVLVEGGGIMIGVVGSGGSAGSVPHRSARRRRLMEAISDLWPVRGALGRALETRSLEQSLRECRELEAAALAIGAREQAPRHLLSAPDAPFEDAVALLLESYRRAAQNCVSGRYLAAYAQLVAADSLRRRLVESLEPAAPRVLLQAAPPSSD